MGLELESHPVWMVSDKLPNHPRLDSPANPQNRGMIQAKFFAAPPGWNAFNLVGNVNPDIPFTWAYFSVWHWSRMNAPLGGAFDGLDFPPSFFAGHLQPLLTLALAPFFRPFFLAGYNVLFSSVANRRRFCGYFIPTASFSRCPNGESSRSSAATVISSEANFRPNSLSATT